MASVETVATSLNGNFKNVYGKSIQDLVPETDILYRNDRIKFVSKKGREGLQFNQPVMVAFPSSATWGLNGPTLNSPIAMQMANATVTGSAITMRDVLSYDAAARAASCCVNPGRREIKVSPFVNANHLQLVCNILIRKIILI